MEIGDHELKIVWSDTFDRDYYRIYRSFDEEPFVLIDSVMGSSPDTF